MIRHILPLFRLFAAVLWLQHFQAASPVTAFAPTFPSLCTVKRPRIVCASVDAYSSDNTSGDTVNKKKNTRRECLVGLATATSMNFGGLWPTSPSVAVAAEQQPPPPESLTNIPTECQSGALMAESAVPGAYDQICMNLPLRTIPLRVPTQTSSTTTTVNLQIQQEGVGPGKTGLAVWNSALLLGRLLEALAAANNNNNPGSSSFLQNQQLAEIGCGTGLVSIMASRLGAKSVWATDGNPAAVALTEANFDRNGIPYTRSIVLPSLSSASSVSSSEYNNNIVTVLQWGELQVPLEWMGKADIVVGSDLTYNSGSWRVLAETMESLLSRKGVVLYLSLGHAGFNVRGEVDGFLSVAKQVGLTVKSTTALPFALPAGVSSLDTLLQGTILPSEQSILSATGGAQVVVLGRP